VCVCVERYGGSERSGGLTNSARFVMKGFACFLLSLMIVRMKSHMLILNGYAYHQFVYRNCMLNGEDFANKTDVVEQAVLIPVPFIDNSHSGAVTYNVFGGI